MLSISYKQIQYLIFFLLSIYLVRFIYLESSHKKEMEPFFNSEEIVQVCKKPYFSSADCNMLAVKIIDEMNNVSFTLPSGEQILATLTMCYYGGREPRYKFCRTYDHGDQYDLLPTWLNY